MQYLIIIEITVLSLISIIVLDKLGKILKLFDEPSEKKIHLSNITNIAGAGLIIIILNALLLFDYSSEISTSLNIMMIFIIIGLYDDIKKLDPSLKLIFLLIPTIIYTQDVGLVFELGEYNGFLIKLGSFSFIFTVLSILFLINAFNYMDGMDGLLGTTSIISLLFFLIFIPVIEISFIFNFIIFILVYLIFNLGIFKKLPKVFMGDSGSIGIGFLFCVLIIYYTQNLKIIHPSVLIWPIAFIVYEFITVNIIRILNKKNPLERDLNFIFNKFLSKYSNTKTLIYCNLINLFFCVIGSMVYYFEQYTLSLILFLIIFFIYFYLRFKQNKLVTS